MNVTGYLPPVCRDFLNRELAAKDIPLIYKTLTGSTNNDAKALIKEGRRRGLLLAEAQNQGRGRASRRFFSPGGTGLYFTYFFTEQLSPEIARLLPLAAAEAAARSLKEQGVFAGIKWVNDLLVTGRDGREKKAGGILCEALFGREQSFIVGIGINLLEPDGGFPEEIRQRAGALFGEAAEVPELFREKLVIQITNALQSLPHITAEKVTKAYNELCLSKNRLILADFPDGRQIRLMAGEVLADGRLRAEDASGNIYYLSNEEISILHDKEQEFTNGRNERKERFEL